MTSQLIHINPHKYFFPSAPASALTCTSHVAAHRLHGHKLRRSKHNVPTLYVTYPQCRREGPALPDDVNRLTRLTASNYNQSFTHYLADYCMAVISG